MLFKSRDEKRKFGIMNFHKKFEMEMKKEYLWEFDAFGKCRQVLEQNGWNLPSKISQIDTF